MVRLNPHRELNRLAVLVYTSASGAQSVLDSLLDIAVAIVQAERHSRLKHVPIEGDVPFA